MTTRISVTELDNWVDCHRKWYLSNKMGYRPKPEEVGVSPTLSGSAIHFGIEAGLGRPKNAEPYTYALEAATTFLEAHGEGSERYRRGVHAALLGVPKEYWSASHMSEDKMVLEYVIPNGEIINMVGVPDIWFYDGAGAIIIVDMKSTSKEESDRAMTYQLWNMQPHFYAVLLEDYLRHEGIEVPPIYVKHDILSTRGKHFYGEPQLTTKGHRQRMRDRMLLLAGQIAEAHKHEHSVFESGKLSYMCKMCDFADVDALALTGRDPQGILDEQYTTREERGGR